MQAYLTRTLSRRAPPIGHEVIGGSVTEIDSFTGMALRTKEALRSRRAFAACARDDACYGLPVATVRSSTHMLWSTGDPSPMYGAIMN